MEIVNLIFSAENIRTIVLLFGVLYGVLYLDRKFEKKFDEQEKKLDGKFGEFENRFSDFEKRMNETLDARFTAFHKQLKENDFAHLENTIKALTFMLEKNKFLTVEDKGFIDSHLEN